MSYSSQRSAFNRRTGLLLNCCGASVNSDTTARQSGQGFAWPFDTQQQTYQVYNVTLMKPVPAIFAGTATVGGLTTYEFTEQVNNQKFGTEAVPGSLVGISQASVNLGEYLTATDSYWVDPVTGAPIKVSENQTVSLEDSTGATRLILLQGDLTSSPQSISAAVSDIHSDRTKISAVENTGPLVGVVLGIVLLVMGLVLAATAPGAREYVYDDHPGGGGGGGDGDGDGDGDGERLDRDAEPRHREEELPGTDDELSGRDDERSGEEERSGEVVGGPGGEQADSTA